LLSELSDADFGYVHSAAAASSKKQERCALPSRYPYHEEFSELAQINPEIPMRHS
jgi:hypothetical protein